MIHKKILVIGSTNMDMVVKTKHIPVPGETILAESFFMNPGGKGANQAVAAARLGSEVAFVTKVGNDVFGKQAIQLFTEEGIDTSYLLSDNELPSGVALISVDKAGENSIVVAPGANANLYPKDLNEIILGSIDENTIILMQLEIPVETVAFVADYAKKKGATVILNPAPMTELPPDVLSNIDILTPNKTEAQMLCGTEITDINSAQKSAKLIYGKGVKNVIITMGGEGAIIYNAEYELLVPALKMDAVDTTAAGDVFNGALAVAISEGKKLTDATMFACEAAGISVTKMGAQSSIPYRNEVILKQMSFAR